ncbi:MAG: DUF4131 domain-containing protein, partial [Acidimicrobiia bacterium]
MRFLPVAVASTFLIGIVVGVSLVFVSMPLLLLAWCAWHLSVLSYLSGFPRGVEVWALLGLLLTGMSVGGSAEKNAQYPLLLRQLNEEPPAHPVVVEGRLRKDAFPTDHGVVVDLAAQALRRAGLDQPTSGGVRITVGGGRSADRLGEWRAGRTVRLRTVLRVPAVYRNPGVRNERAALARHGIQLFGSTKSALLVSLVSHGSY